MSLTIPGEILLFKTDEWRHKYVDELYKYRLLTVGQQDGIRNHFLSAEREAIMDSPLGGTDEYEEIMQAQEIMDKLTT